MKISDRKFELQELDSLFEALKGVDKSISTEIEKIRNFQDEIAFSVVKTQCKIHDRIEILQSLSGHTLIKEANGSDI